MDDLKVLTTKVKDFCDKRDWEQFHNLKDLSIALSIESSELQELFLWKSKDEIESLMNSSKREKVEEELADVFYYVLRFADISSIDLEKALLNKLEKNNNKYPVEKSKGNNLKYSELDSGN